MLRISRVVTTSFALVALAAAGVAGQSVSDIVDRMYAAYERQADGINDYTLVQTVLGLDNVNYFEKEMVDGKPVFKLKSSGTGFTFGLGDEEAGQGDIFLLGPKLKEHGRYAGREQIDGRSMHVIAVDDVSRLDITQPDAGDMEFVAKTARFLVDADMSIPRRFEFTGEARTADGATHEITMRVDMSDVRDVQGLLIPHRTAIQIDGIGAMIDPEMQAQLAQMEQQLAALPPDQRQMMERMIGPQMEQIRQMVAGAGGGGMNMEVTVKEVRVNTGPPRQ